MITRSSSTKLNNEIDIESVNLGSNFMLTLYNKDKKDEQTTDEKIV